MKYKGEKEYTLSVLLTTVKSLTDLKNRPKKFGNKSWFFLFFLFVTKTKTKRKKKRKEKKREFRVTSTFRVAAHSSHSLQVYNIIITIILFNALKERKKGIVEFRERIYLKMSAGIASRSGGLMKFLRPRLQPIDVQSAALWGVAATTTALWIVQVSFPFHPIQSDFLFYLYFIIIYYLFLISFSKNMKNICIMMDCILVFAKSKII